MSTIVLCGSTVFYDHLAVLANELEARGFTCAVPSDVLAIRQGKPYDAATAKTWYDNPEDFKLKAAFIREHFQEVANGDAVLVVNDEKHGIPGYIGPNVLMEMGLAFYLNKSIYVLNKVDKDLPVYEEVLGMGAIMLNGDLNLIS